LIEAKFGPDSEFVDELLEVRVAVFRRFERGVGASSSIPKTNRPERVFTIRLALP
jgi:hypothetical protein